MGISTKPTEALIYINYENPNARNTFFSHFLFCFLAKQKKTIRIKQKKTKPPKQR